MQEILLEGSERITIKPAWRRSLLGSPKLWNGPWARGSFLRPPTPLHLHVDPAPPQLSQHLASLGCRVSVNLARMIQPM
jgi:hypothetical protein